MGWDGECGGNGGRGWVRQLLLPLAIHKRLHSPRALSITEHFIIAWFGGGEHMNAIINAPSRGNIFIYS